MLQSFPCCTLIAYAYWLKEYNLDGVCLLGDILTMTQVNDYNFVNLHIDQIQVGILISNFLVHSTCFYELVINI